MDDRGSVTAEFALVVPAVLLLLACCMGGMQLAAEQLRVQHAAVAAARTFARGDGTGVAAQLVPGAHVEAGLRGDLACVTVSSAGAAAAGLLGSIRLSASSCALSG